MIQTRVTRTIAEPQDFGHPAANGYLRSDGTRVEQSCEVDYEQFPSNGGVGNRYNLKCPSVLDRTLTCAVTRKREQHWRGKGNRKERSGDEPRGTEFAQIADEGGAQTL